MTSNMKPDVIRLTKIHEWSIYILSAIVFLSGMSWLYFYYFVRIEGEYGLQIHPLQHTSLVVHGTSALFLLIGLGTVIPIHVVKSWKIKRNRKSGGLFLALFSLLIVTGIGLYYLGGESIRNVTSVLHWVVGISFPLVLAAHIYFGKKKHDKG